MTWKAPDIIFFVKHCLAFMCINVYRFELNAFIIVSVFSSQVDQSSNEIRFHGDQVILLMTL